MWVVVNRCLNLGSFTEELITSMFAVRSDDIRFVEAGKEGFFKLTLYGAEEIMCYGDFGEFMKFLGSIIDR